MTEVKDTGVIPECYVDTNLTETLTGIICNHQKGCANVIKQMKEKRSDRFALGIIDYDKRRVSYIDEFEEVAGNETLKLMKHRERPHYLIFIIPAVEVFVLKAAEEKKLNMNSFGLPSALEDLKRETKQQDSKKDPRFRELFTALSDSSSFRILRELVVYLQANPYTADKDVLTSYFNLR